MVTNPATVSTEQLYASGSDIGTNFSLPLSLRAKWKRDLGDFRLESIAREWRPGGEARTGAEGLALAGSKHLVVPEIHLFAKVPARKRVPGR